MSFDFGYGIMQITSGMAGAFGSVEGHIGAGEQSEIASDYLYNIAYGARMLAKKWESVPRVGKGDAATVEDWYYALWAYNGWGWANNPNNPRFKRTGTPGSDPASYPYQERVLYLVAHPPHDAEGNPLWRPIPVTLPSAKTVGLHPGPLGLTGTHQQAPPRLAGVYKPAQLPPFSAGSTHPVSVRVVNTGTQPWLPSGPLAVSLSYHLLTLSADPWSPFSPFSDGVLAFGQGAVPLGRTVLPGEAASVRVPVSAPTTPGSYRLAWDLQQGMNLWFSQIGTPVMTQKLRVAVSRATPVPSPTPLPTSRPAPAEDLRFVADTSVPDGSSLLVHQHFLKGWLVFNAGKLTWPAGSSLQLVSGSSFGAREVPVPATHSCRSVNIVASMHAPIKSGSYTSVWQMREPGGHLFGDRLTLVVMVRKPTPSATPVPTAGGTPTPTRTAVTPTATPTPVG